MDPSTKRSFKDRIYEQFARIGKALASPRRLEMLDLLAQGEWSVEELAEATGMSVGNASHHLQKLKAAHLVTSRREGTYVHYRLAGPDVAELWQVLRGVGERQLAEVERIVGKFLGHREEVEAVGLEELEERLERSEVELIDVRPEDEYRAGHVKGARSVPVDRVEDFLEQLPKDREVVAYCRGPYCMFSDEAVATLRERGLTARRLEAGFPGLRSSGFPVETERADEASADRKETIS